MKHSEEIDKARKELFRVLKPKGKLVVGLPIEGLLTRLSWKLFLRSDFDHPVRNAPSVIKNLEKSFNLTYSRDFISKRFGLGLYTVICFEKTE